MRLTPFDRSLLRRTSGSFALVLATAVGVVVTTDEPGSGVAQRLARLGLAGPALAGLALWISLEVSRRRGELLALGALGAAPSRAALGALLAAWGLGLAGVLLAASPWADQRALLPVLDLGVGWLPADGGLLAPEHGVRLAPDGSLSWSEVALGQNYSMENNPELAPGARPLVALAAGARPLAALAAGAPLALLLPLWALAAARPTWRHGLGAVVSAMALIGGLHLVAAGQLAPWVVALASLPLLAGLPSELWSNGLASRRMPPQC